MNNFNLLAIFLVFIIFTIILIYYIYEDLKFKKKLKSNFNLFTTDILINNERITVLDADNDKNDHKLIMQKDIVNKNNDSDQKLFLFDNKDHKYVNENINEYDLFSINKPLQKSQSFLDTEELKETHIVQEIPIGSMEEFFLELDKIPFPFDEKINNKLDFVIDIIFENVHKLKFLPQINQFIIAPFECYVLNKNSIWIPYSGKKYEVKALKLIISLVDCHGPMNTNKINLIYNELHQYVVKNNAHLRLSEYNDNLISINKKYNSIKNIDFLFQIYIKVSNPIIGLKLHKYLIENKFTENNGKYDYIHNNVNLFTISAENHNPINKKDELYIILISSKFHLVNNVLYAFDQIIDFSEEFMRNFNAHLYTINKKLINQEEFDILNNQVEEYNDKLNAINIKSETELINRIFK